MRTRTSAQHVMAYQGLTTTEFARATGQSAARVRRMIAEQWFGVMDDGRPECLDISAAKAGRRTYRIHPAAVKRFLDERSKAA